MNDQIIPCDILLSHIQDGVFAVRDGHIVYGNRQLVEISGYALEALIGRPFQEVIAPEDLPMVQDRYWRRLAGEAVPELYEFHLLHADGQKRVRVLMSVGMVREGLWAGTAVGTLKDLTAHELLLQKLQKSTDNLQNIIDSLPDVYYQTDGQGRLVFISPMVQELLGYEVQELLGTLLSDLYVEPAQRAELVQAMMRAPGKAVLVEAALRHKSGKVVWVSTRARAKLDAQGRLLAVEGLARDLSERWALEQHMHYMATHDVLTGLLNRQEFTNRLELALVRDQREQYQFALVFLDLDDFKQINDRHGHLVGDAVLRGVAERLLSLVRGSDAVGRLGGDEFVLLLESQRLTHEDILGTVQRILETVREPRHCLGHEVCLGCSIGIAVYPEHGDSVDVLLSQADKAMYQAKRDGKHAYRFA